MVSVGYAVGLDTADPTNDPHAKFQRYKMHKLLRGILEGGTMLHYGAKTIPVGGFHSVPRLFHDGLLLCGDAAGMLNARKLKGIHLAIKSGIVAAETLHEAVKAGDYSPSVLRGYEDRFERSWARRELWQTRNFHAGFEGGLWAGMFAVNTNLITSSC